MNAFFVRSDTESW